MPRINVTGKGSGLIQSQDKTTLKSLSDAELERVERSQARKIISHAPDFKVRGAEVQLQQMRQLERLAQSVLRYKNLIDQVYRPKIPESSIGPSVSASAPIMAAIAAQNSVKRPDFSHLRLQRPLTAQGFKPLGPLAQNIAQESAKAEAERLAQSKAAASAEKYYMKSIVETDNSRFKDELEKKKLLESAEKKTMSALVALDNKRFKDEQKHQKERTALEERGERRLYLMAQDEFRAKEKATREADRLARKSEVERERQERQKEQRNAPVRRAAGALGLVGLTAALGQGSAQNLLGEAGGAIGTLIGGATGSPAIAEAVGAVGKLIGGLILNPFSAIQSAMKPALDYRISAGRLGIAAGGGGIADLFYSGKREPLSLLRRFGLSPQDAVAMISSLGVVPQRGQMTNLVSAIGGAGFSRPFANMAPGTIERTLGQGAALGLANFNNPNSVNRYLSGMGGIMEEATAKGLDRSKLLAAMQDSFETLASSGAIGANQKAFLDIFQRGIDSGMIGGRTGVLANQAISNVQDLANNPFRNPAMTVRLMQELQKNNNLSTPEDVTRLLGIKGQRAIDISKAPQGMKMFEIAQNFAANPDQMRRILMPNGAGNNETQAFLASILYGGNPAQWLTYFGGGGTAPTGNIAPDQGNMPSRELGFQAKVANAGLFASDANLGRLANAADDVAKKLDYVTAALGRFADALDNPSGQKRDIGTGLTPPGVAILPWLDKNIFGGKLSGDTSTTRVHILH